MAGFNLPDKAVLIYLALLERGSSSIRQIAEASRINRQTTHELLRTLIERGLVTYYSERSREAYVAEDPNVILSLADAEVEKLTQRRDELKNQLAELRQRSGRARLAATVRFYQYAQGVHAILEDVLAVMRADKEKLYRVYSAAAISPVLHDAFPDFTKRRIAAGIRVRVLGLGGHGVLHGLDERRQLTTKISAPTYIIIYARKVAMISLDDNDRPRGVLIEDPALAETQRLIFETHWEGIGKK